MDNKDLKILMTGAGGFLGTHVVSYFSKQGFSNLLVPSRADYDLLVQSDVQKLFKQHRSSIDIVIHMAADIGGLGYSSYSSGKQLYNNSLMNLMVQHEAYKSGAGKFVGVGTVCSYPENTPVPFVETEVWNGYPVPTNAAYGISKRIMLEHSQAYRQQYNFNAIHLLMVNLYGMGDDTDLKNSHVIPAIIRKIKEAQMNGSDHIEVWGSGKATREFVNAKDAARAIYNATLTYDQPEPVNIGSGEEISIHDLVYLISDIMKYEGKLMFNTDKPDGQMRRALDTSKAKALFNFQAEISLEDGIKEYIEWYNHQ
jgi:GDP-L-fucose synthase